MIQKTKEKPSDIDVTRNPVVMPVAKFAALNRVCEDTIDRNPSAYPPIRKIGGRRMMRVIEIERWGGLRD